MKKNNKILLMVLVCLIGIFIATKVFRTPARESNLETSLFAIDTSLIRTVSFVRPGAGTITLKRDDKNWTVTEEGKQASAAAQTVRSFLSTISKVRPARVVSRSEDKWSIYQVDDSTSIHFTALDADNEPVIDWRIGKTSQGVTYVRPENDAEVYAMEGSFRSIMDDEFNDWRDKTFVRIPSGIRKITFTYPSDSGFVLNRVNDHWMINEQKADSSKVEKYLLKWQSRSLREFADAPPDHEPDVTIVVASDSDTVTVNGWKDTGDAWIVRSTLQEDVYFRDTRIDDDLFAGRQAFR